MWYKTINLIFNVNWAPRRLHSTFQVYRFALGVLGDREAEFTSQSTIRRLSKQLKVHTVVIAQANDIFKGDLRAAV